jgi:hypothetical protein
MQLHAPRPCAPPPSVEDVERAIFHGFQTWGADSIEVEYRLGKLNRQKFFALLETLSNCKVLVELPPTKTKEQFNGTDARLIHDIAHDGTEMNERTVYKKKLITLDLPKGIRLQTCVERYGNPSPGPYTMYRIKSRRSFVFKNIWRFDLTTVETNDPRFSDADDYMYEVEIELLTLSDPIYYYTVNHLLEWGGQLALQLLQIIT